MSETTAYLIALVALVALALFLAAVVWLQDRDLRQSALREQVLRERCDRQRARIRQRRGHCERYHVGELDAVAEATRRAGIVPEPLEVAVQRDIDALPVTEPTDEETR